MGISPDDDERLLDALLANARGEPKPAGMGRVEQRLRPWISGAPPKAPSRLRRLIKPALALLVVGLVVQQFGSTERRRRPV